MAVDRKLHDAIASQCGNDRLAHEIRRYDTMVQGLREIAGNRLRVQHRAIHEHIPIMQALAAHDADAAADAMSLHIKEQSIRIEQIVFARK
jgi:DNA-binding GntR family transcriptional regulator